MNANLQFMIATLRFMITIKIKNLRYFVALRCYPYLINSVPGFPVFILQIIFLINRDLSEFKRFHLDRGQFIGLNPVIFHLIDQALFSCPQFVTKVQDYHFHFFVFIKYILN
jgi:hypothetical protein